MIAPEPTPTAEHRDAIARLVWATSRADESTISAIGAQAVTHAILTSTDPAVHAAMLAALVREGVLTWQHDSREWREPPGLIPRGRNNGVRWAARRVVGEWESDYAEVSP